MWYRSRDMCQTIKKLFDKRTKQEAIMQNDQASTGATEQHMELSLDNLNDLRVLTGHSHLTTLDLSNCSEISDLSPLVELTNLRTLKLGSCRQMRDLSALAGLTALTELD